MKGPSPGRLGQKRVEKKGRAKVAVRGQLTVIRDLQSKWTVVKCGADSRYVRRM